MKSKLKFTAVAILTAAIGVLFFSGCSKGSSGGGGGTSYSAGDMEIYTADSISFNMAYVPGKTFPTGTDDLGTSTVTSAYWIGETEVTYELWKKIYDWATNADRGIKIYNFKYAGTMGGGSGIFTNQHPVTTINWRDSMVWCNALTEWYNAQNSTGYTCVYTYSSTIIRDSRDLNETACDGAVAGSTATGFRLLTSNEWELAARWRNDSTNTVAGYADPYFTKGNSASGATTFYNDATGDPDYAGRLANDIVAVYKYYSDGGGPVDNGTTATAAVKSKVNGTNSLGLYDMSGNVFEWCFDFELSSSERVIQGGCWQCYVALLQIGEGDITNDPTKGGPVLGFRFARTQ